MRLVVTAEVRYLRTPDGRVWTLTAGGYSFWARYIETFDRLRIVARVLDLATVPEGATRVDGDRVEVWAVPHYLGPVGYLRRLPAVRRAVQRSAEPEDVVILRVPSPIGTLLANHRRRHGLPFAVEVVGDPQDVFAAGVVDHPLRPLVRWRAVADLRRQCHDAAGVAYVTESALQRRYPPGRGALATSFSCIEMTPESYVDKPRPVEDSTPYRLVSVGSLEQLYKGVDTLVGAVAILSEAGLALRLTHVGDGRYAGALRQLAERRGIADRVRFVGALPAGAPVRAHLDTADLFVMPSRTEGLPRALIEAMARGLPAVGTDVGGIGELIGPDVLVPPDDEARLAAAIAALLLDPERRERAGAANLRRARDYATDVLAPRRARWYRSLAPTAPAASTGQDRAKTPNPDRSPAGSRPPVPRQARTATVLHVIGTLDRGGAETVALDLCRILPPDRIHQTFVTLGGREGALADQFRAAGATVTQAPLRPLPAFPVRLWRTLRAHRPDVVVSHVSLASAVVLLVARLAGVPTRVARMHSEGDGRRGGPRRRLQRWVLRGLLARCATDVVGVTGEALRFAAPRPGDIRYRVLPNGVDLGRLNGPHRRTARDDLGLPHDVPVLVHIGRASPEKNRGFLIDILRAAQRRHAGATLLVAGPGGHDDLAAHHPGALGDPAIVLLGDRSDIGPVLAAADVLLLPSVREGLPGVVLEALASGVPAVATDLPGLREINREVVGLHLLGLSEGAGRWAEAALQLSDLDSRRRERIRQTLLTSPFTMERAAKEWEALCQPRV